MASKTKRDLELDNARLEGALEATYDLVREVLGIDDDEDEPSDPVYDSADDVDDDEDEGDEDDDG